MSATFTAESSGYSAGGSSPKKAEQGVRHDNHFTTVRLCLALMVLGAHACEFVDGNRSREPLTLIFGTLSLGEVAVDSFFILSGFLVLQSWERAPDAFIFLRKRACRIYPGFIAASLIGVLAFGPFGASNPARYLSAVWQGAAVIPYCLLLLLPPKTPFIFAGLRYNSIQGALWTIHYEFCCYVTLAILGVAGLLKRGKIAGLWVTTLGLYLILGLGTGAGGTPVAPSEGFGVAIRFALFFLSGAVLAQWPTSLSRTRLRLTVASLVLVAGLTCRNLAEPALATAGAWLIIMAGSLQRRGRTLPDLSYGLYLYGTPVELLLVFRGGGLTPFEVFVGAVLGAGLLSFASWHLIEAPALTRWRRHKVC